MSKKFRSAKESAKAKKAMKRRFGRLNDSDSNFTPTGGEKNKKQIWKDRISGSKYGNSKKTEKAMARKRAADEKNRKNPEWVKKRNAQQKAYREKNPKKMRAQGRAYYEKNREKLNARNKAYREANREKISAQKRAYREKKKKDASK